MNKVYVAIYTHRYDTDVRVFETESSADKWRIEIAEEYWVYVFGLGRPKPDDLGKLADMYWDHLLNHGIEEYFEIRGAEIEQ